MVISIQARVVFPVDRPPIEHGVVSIEGERILSVGSGPGDGEVLDLGAVALLPGLVNAHTHLEFSPLSRPLGERGMRLIDWIRLVIAERGTRGSSFAQSAEIGCRECVRHGVTTVGDIATSTDAAPARLFDVVRFVEVIGFSRARAASAFADTLARLDQLSTRCGTSQLGISPHAPYTVSPDLLARLVALANERNLPVAMHVAESAEEIELLCSGSGPFQQLLEERSMWDAAAIPRGSRPLDYLAALAQAPRALVIHGNFLDDKERAFIAAHHERMSLVHCPRTHAYFAHPVFPLDEWLHAGVSVALGTDSRASNPDLNLLSEMSHLFRTHPGVSPHQLLEMGTLAGARALGRDSEVGSITPGKLANLVAIPCLEGDALRPDERLAAIFSGNVAPSAVWLRGKQQYSELD